MAKIIITRGLPGSGKSTWAESYAKIAKNTAIVERDALRLQLFGVYWTGKPEDEERVTRLQDKLVRSYLAEGTSVVISDTHLPDRSVKKWLKLGAEVGVPVEVQDFRHVPLAQVLKQNANRDLTGHSKYVDPKVITDKYERFIKGRNLDKVVEYTPSTKAKIEPYVQPKFETEYKCVIFDIDNTYAIMGNRSPYDGEKVHIDTVNADVDEALRMYYAAGVDVIFVSGRSEDYRGVTERWFDANGTKYDKLYMRPSGDSREDSIIKHELFNKHIRPLNYRILGVYDDRHRVLRMWRELGLTTFHVNGPDAGNF